MTPSFTLKSMRSPNRLACLVLVIASVIGSAFSGIPFPDRPARAQESFIPPDLTGFRPHREGVFDFDAQRDGEVDTFGRDFRNPFGDRVIQFSALSGDGGMWGIFVDQSDTDGGTTMLDGDYLLVDTDCDGAFDARLALDTELTVPACFAQ